MEIWTDVVHAGRRKNPLAAARDRGRSDDVVHAWQGRRANRGDAAELAGEKWPLLLFSVGGQGDLAHAPSGVLSTPGKFSAVVESDRRRSSAPGDQRDRVEIAREALSDGGLAVVPGHDVSDDWPGAIGSPGHGRPVHVHSVAGVAARGGLAICGMGGAPANQGITETPSVRDSSFALRLPDPPTNRLLAPQLHFVRARAASPPEQSNRGE